ncbi:MULTISPECIES: SDR family oxidoreductase [unclassified Microbacterium]|uniref:SDR family oxidoreductase n=1 Tax=unclassified Microbacterium TaxID=2609290 RepID=UPI00365B6AC8
MTADMHGQIAIVTGTTNGVGAATAHALLDAGAHVIGVARRSLEQAGLPVDEFDRGRYVHITGDAADPATAESAAAAALASGSRIDLLVNNAGIGRYADLVETSIDDYDEIMSANVRSTYAFTRAVVDTMIAQRSGTILQIVSQSGLNGYAGEALYCASKHAQMGFTHALRQELQPFGIRVGAICPAGIRTEFAIGHGRTAASAQSARYLSPDDVAQAVLFAATLEGSAMMTDIQLMSVAEY